jgi:dienelactone hydrolase
VGIDTKHADGAWVFRPAGEPKRLVIFFHGQGDETEATPVNHRAWIDHLVSRGAVVVYPRYEQVYAKSVLDPAVAGIRNAANRVDLTGLPVLALGYSRGAALAVEYAAVAPARQVPVPQAVEVVNPVPYGETSRIVDLHPLRSSTRLDVVVSKEDPHAADGAGLLFARLQTADFPGEHIKLHVARSHGSFIASHLGPLGTSPGARKAYWVPADRLLASLSSPR